MQTKKEKNLHKLIYYSFNQQRTKRYSFKLFIKEEWICLIFVFPRCYCLLQYYGREECVDSEEKKRGKIVAIGTVVKNDPIYYTVLGCICCRITTTV